MAWRCEIHGTVDRCPFRFMYCDAGGNGTTVQSSPSMEDFRLTSDEDYTPEPVGVKWHV